MFRLILFDDKNVRNANMYFIPSVMFFLKTSRFNIFFRSCLTTGCRLHAFTTKSSRRPRFLVVSTVTPIVHFFVPLTTLSSRRRKVSGYPAALCVRALCRCITGTTLPPSTRQTRTQRSPFQSFSPKTLSDVRFTLAQTLSGSAGFFFSRSHTVRLDLAWTRRTLRKSPVGSDTSNTARSVVETNANNNTTANTSCNSRVVAERAGRLGVCRLDVSPQKFRTATYTRLEHVASSGTI